VLVDFILRLGHEGAVSGQAGPVALGTTATWLRYTYEDFTVDGTSLEGNRVPGVSPLVVAAYASVSPTWGLVALEAQRVGRQAVDDANTAHADAYVVANARVAFRLPTQLAVTPAFGIDNLFDKTYASNVVVNAARGRFYEPGAGRTYYLSIRMGTR
jgi:iron complex outermembrane receptor protein